MTDPARYLQLESKKALAISDILWVLGLGFRRLGSFFICYCPLDIALIELQGPNFCSQNVRRDVRDEGFTTSLRVVSIALSLSSGQDVEPR